MAYEIAVKLRSARTRQRDDHYPTPSGLVRAALLRLAATYPSMQPRTILDHSAGTGVWGAVARELWPSAYIIGCELQPTLVRSSAYDEWHDGCSFAWYAARALRTGRRPDLIIGNPPYKTNMPVAFIKLGLAMLTHGGLMIQLLRSALLEGQERGVEFWPHYCPTHVWTCSRRPSFTGDMRTDATSYSLFVHQAGTNPNHFQGSWFMWDYDPPLAEDRPMQMIAGILTDGLESDRQRERLAAMPIQHSLFDTEVVA